MSGNLLDLFLVGRRAVLLRGLITLTLFQGCKRSLGGRQIFFCGSGVRISFCVPRVRATVRISCGVSSGLRAGRHRIKTLGGLPSMLTYGQHVVVACSRRSAISSRRKIVCILPF